MKRVPQNMLQWIILYLRALLAWLIALIIMCPIWAAGGFICLGLALFFATASGDFILGTVILIYTALWGAITYTFGAMLPTIALGAAALSLSREADRDLLRYGLPILLLACSALISTYLYSYHFSNYRAFGSNVLDPDRDLNLVRFLVALFLQASAFLMAGRILGRLCP